LGARDPEFFKIFYQKRLRGICVRRLTEQNRQSLREDSKENRRQKENKKKGKAHWKPKVNDKVLLRTQPVSDATAGVTAKLLHPYKGPYIIAKIIPPSTFELADENARIRDQFNEKLLKAYKEATKGDEIATEWAVEVSAR
jgi:hypothetical protein